MADYFSDLRLASGVKAHDAAAFYEADYDDSNDYEDHYFEQEHSNCSDTDASDSAGTGSDREEESPYCSSPSQHSEHWDFKLPYSPSLEERADSAWLCNPECEDDLMIAMALAEEEEGSQDSIHDAVQTGQPIHSGASQTNGSALCRAWRESNCWNLSASALNFCDRIDRDPRPFCRRKREWAGITAHHKAIRSNNRHVTKHVLAQNPAHSLRRSQQPISSGSSIVPAKKGFEVDHSSPFEEDNPAFWTRKGDQDDDSESGEEPAEQGPNNVQRAKSWWSRAWAEKLKEREIKRRHVAARKAHGRKGKDISIDESNITIGFIPATTSRLRCTRRQEENTANCADTNQKKSMSESRKFLGLRDSTYRFDDFHKFRYQFYHKNREALYSALRSDYGNIVTGVRLAPIAGHVRGNFLAACKRTRKDPVVCYHGTRVQNMDSILAKGLLIPGKHNVKVLNGSAFGVGIYTSRTAGYSLGYTHGTSTMFVCAVLDNTPSKANVTTSGNIVVLFDESLVIPVFLLDFSPTSGANATPPASSAPARRVGKLDSAFLRSLVLKIKQRLRATFAVNQRTVLAQLQV